MTSQTLAKGTIEAMLHTGNAIWYIAQLYSDPMDAVLEMVQNALDKQATKILVEIHRERPARLAVYDNGVGASIEEIQQKFVNICRSFKQDDPNAIGEKGIGNLAGIAISEEYYLITKPKQTRKPYFRISLKREEVIDQANVRIPWEEIGPVAELRTGFSTLVMLKRVDARTAATLSDLDALSEAIAANYSERIRKRNIEVRLESWVRGGCATTKKVEAQEFPGQKQDPIEIATEFGPVVFEFYSTIVARKKPKILIEHKKKFSLDLWVKMMKFLPEVCRTVFCSGYFQGYIRLNFGTLEGGRKDFVRDTEREALIQALITFCQDYGLSYVEELRRGEKLDSYERIIEAALEPLGRFFKEHPGELPDIFHGVTSTGHIKAEKGQSLSLTFRKITQRRKITPPIRSRKIEGNPAKEKRMIHINTQQTREGQSRRDLHKQRGLTIILEEGSLDTGLKWRSRIVDGCIHINISHRDWGLVTDRGKTVAVEYVNLLLLKELSRASLGSFQGKAFHEHFETVLMPYFVGACTVSK